MQAEEQFLEQIRQIGRLTKAQWAGWVIPENGKWDIQTSWHLTARRRKLLTPYLQHPTWTAWLSGALANGRWRTRKVSIGDAATLGARLYAFPSSANGGVLLVGAEALTNEQRQMWRIATLSAPRSASSASAGKPASVCAYLTEKLSESGYQLQASAEVITAAAREMFPALYAYIAISEGRSWRIIAVQGGKTGTWARAEAHEDTLEILHSLHQGQVIQLQQEPWPQAPPSPVSWMAAPLAQGQRLIGFLAIALPPDIPATAEKQEALQALAQRVVWVLEHALAFEQAGEHLRRKAILNDALLAMLTSDTLEEAIQSTTRYLWRILRADVAMVLLPQPDGTLEPAGMYPMRPLPPPVPIANSLCGYVLETGKVMRVGDVRKAPRYVPLDDQIRSELCAPMRSKSGIVGVLNLESARLDAFTEEDERLLTAIAGQLALMLEVVRLREDAAARAQRMEMVHQIVKDVVGLTDVQQVVDVAAQRLADYFGYEITAIVITDERLSKPLYCGVVGASKETYPRGAAGWPKGGIVSQVLETGQSILINDVEAEPRYRPFPNFVAGSELCVPLLSHENGQRVIGFINIERTQKHAFTEEDRITIEAVSGVLSSVISNASRYHQSQTTVQHLEAVRQTGLDIISDLEMDTLLQRVIHRVKTLLNVDGAEIGLVDAVQGEVRIVASESPWKKYTDFVLPLGEGVGGQVAVSGETLVVEDYHTWEGRNFEMPPAIFRAVVSVPLKFHDEVLGVLTVYDNHPERKFSPDEVRLLEMLAPQVAVALRNARLYSELEDRIAKQERAEAELVQSARLAAVGDMAAAVAHELNNPLTTVMGFVELALEDLSPEDEMYDGLALALREARRSRDIVRRLLDFARRPEPLRIASDINALIHETISMVGHLLATSGVVLDVVLADDLPLIEVDRAEIKQVLLSLIHNAINAMPHGGELRISSALTDNARGRWVVVHVTDSGAGMTTEQKQRAFEPFYTTHRRGDSESLRLAVSYSIIQKHGGTIEVESAEGQGSTFTIYLPAV